LAGSRDGGGTMIAVESSVNATTVVFDTAFKASKLVAVASALPPLLYEP
jgi:hypothetical protein